MAETTYWGVHANFAKAEELLLTKGRVALGWPAVGDLSAFGKDKEALKAKLKETHPASKPGAIPVYAGELYRFVNEVAEGDVVLYRSRSEPVVHMGRVKGPYFYDPKTNDEYPNCRPVEWFREVPITDVSQGALYELGAFLSWFMVKTYTDEWAQLAAGAKPTIAVEVDDTVAEVSAATELNTRDFIRKRLAQDLKGHPFSHFVADLLRTMGYRTRVAPEGADGGVDIIAHRDELGFEPPIIKVQVKSSAGSVGGPTVAELLGNLSTTDHGLFVSLGTYAPQAKQKAGGRVRLIDGDELVDLILAHYEDLDSRYKAVIPLKRMYVPQPPAEE
jgi:restriction system protein